MPSDRERMEKADDQARLSRFSKDRRVHEAMTYYTLYRYNFCWVVRTLRRRDERADGSGGHSRWPPGWPTTSRSIREWVSFPAVQVA